MKYDNKSRKELIELINKQNQTINELNEQLYEYQKKTDEANSEGIDKLVEDLRKQRKVQADIINELREGKAGLMRILTKLNVSLDTITE